MVKEEGAKDEEKIEEKQIYWNRLPIPPLQEEPPSSFEVTSSEQVLDTPTSQEELLYPQEENVKSEKRKMITKKRIILITIIVVLSLTTFYLFTSETKTFIVFEHRYPGSLTDSGIISKTWTFDNTTSLKQQRTGSDLWGKPEIPEFPELLRIYVNVILKLALGMPWWGWAIALLILMGFMIPVFRNIPKKKTVVGVIVGVLLVILSILLLFLLWFFFVLPVVVAFVLLIINVYPIVYSPATPTDLSGMAWGMIILLLMWGVGFMLFYVGMNTKNIVIIIVGLILMVPGSLMAGDGIILLSMWGVGFMLFYVGMNTKNIAMIMVGLILMVLGPFVAIPPKAPCRDIYTCFFRFP